MMLEEKLTNKAITWVKQKGFTHIKADAPDFESPTKFTKKDGETFTPHITCKKAYKKNYVEIATKTDDIQRAISKWKLLSTLAAMKEGTLYLLAPKGHITYIRQIVKQYQLNAEVIGLK